MAQKNSRHAWLIFLFASPVLAVLGIMALMNPGGDGGPRWPFSSGSLGVVLVVAAILCLPMALYARRRS
jgi:hypothetical protein